MITSEWGTPNMVEAGVNPELLLGGKYGHALHVWDLRTRTHQQTLDLGAEQQMVLELRPAHNPTETYGFVGVVTSLERSLGLDLAVVSRGQQRPQPVEDPQGDRDPGAAGERRAAAGPAERLWRGAAARHRHQPLAGRSLPLRLLLGHG